MESTKQKILEASKKLFNEKGYQNVRMREISSQLDISVGNLTYHFNKKEDILKELMKDVAPLKNEQKANSLIELNEFIRDMLKSIQDYLFFFVSDELPQLNDDFAKTNQQKVELLKTHLMTIIVELRDEGYFLETLSNQTTTAIVEMMMLAHLTWARRVNIHGLTAYPMDDFLAYHWDILSPFFTIRGKKEFEMMSI